MKLASSKSLERRVSKSALVGEHIFLIARCTLSSLSISEGFIEGIILKCAMRSDGGSDST